MLQLFHYPLYVQASRLLHDEDRFVLSAFLNRQTGPLK